MAFAKGKDIGPTILRSLGIDTKGVKSFRLDVSGDSPPEITLVRLVLPSQVDDVALTDEFKKYRAVQIWKDERYLIEEQSKEAKEHADFLERLKAITAREAIKLRALESRWGEQS